MSQPKQFRVVCLNQPSEAAIEAFNLCLERIAFRAERDGSAKRYLEAKAAREKLKQS